MRHDQLNRKARAIAIDHSAGAQTGLASKVLVTSAAFLALQTAWLVHLLLG